MKRPLLCSIVPVLLSFAVSAQTSATDYFRSATTGNWNNVNTWESSPTGAGPWIPATLTPDFNANTIRIRNGHNVTAIVSVTVDQVVIESGGTLTNQEPAANTLTFADGAGYDLEIQTGGVYHVLSDQGYTSYQALTGSATIIIRTGGIIRIGNGGVLAGVDNHLLAATSTSYIWENAAIFDWKVAGAFSSNGVIYFPDAGPAVIPVFRISANPGTVGGSSSTTFNGVFEANAPITFNNGGAKIFRNGMRGNGTITGFVGQFLINGVTAELGGGSLVTPPSGLDIAAGTTVTMVANKTVTGRIDLLGPNTHIELGPYNLTGTTTVNISETTSWVKTNGTGKLIINSVSAPPFGFKIFPVGLSTVNPLVITSNNTANYSVRVDEPVIPIMSDPTRAVLRTWYISCSAGTPGAQIQFGYTFPGDAGVNYVNTGPNAEVAVFIGGVWNRHQSGITPASFFVGVNTFTVNTSTLINYFTAGGPELPFAVGNNGVFLPLDYFIVARAQKTNNNGILRWNVFSTDNLRNFELQRSTNNSGFGTIALLDPVNNQLEYSYTDANLERGTSLYRIKVNRWNGDSRYSNTVAIINDTKGLLVTSITPNPVHHNAVISLSAAQQGEAGFEVFDIGGQRVKQWLSPISEGINNIDADFRDLPAGVYHLLACTPDARTIYRFVKQ